MSDNNENNNGLYFIVGILLTAVVVLGFLYMNNDSAEPNVIERTVERTVETNDEPSSSFSVNIDDNGFSASTESNE